MNAMCLLAAWGSMSVGRGRQSWKLFYNTRLIGSYDGSPLGGRFERYLGVGFNGLGLRLESALALDLDLDFELVTMASLALVS
jgi:hypothetical protein